MPEVEVGQQHPAVFHLAFHSNAFRSFGQMSASPKVWLTPNGTLPLIPSPDRHGIFARPWNREPPFHLYCHPNIGTEELLDEVFLALREFQAIVSLSDRDDQEA